MDLSVNLNKIALLRNSRGGKYPSLEYFANCVLNSDCVGITVHPRPDERHITYKDVILLKNLCQNANKSLNIEGNPKETIDHSYKGFLNIVNEIKPELITLVPDETNQLTSDHGWSIDDYDDLQGYYTNIMQSADDQTGLISIFVNSDEQELEKLVATDDKSIYKPHAIEIFTGPYCDAVESNEKSSIKRELDNIKSIANQARNLNLKVHAGHDLNLENIKKLIELDIIDEVSIGHAIITESLTNGFKRTINNYIEAINGR